MSETTLTNGHTLRARAEVPVSHVSESHAVVRETVYDRGMDVDYLLGLLRNQRVTGTLRVDISQGTVNGIRLEERQKL